MLELVTSDCIISVIPRDTGLIDKVELGCSSMWVTNETVLYDSGGIRVVAVIISVIPVVMVVFGTPDMVSLSGGMNDEAVVSGRPMETSRVEVIA